MATKKAKATAKTAPEPSEWRGSERLRSLLTPIDTLKPDPKNARAHDERSYEAITDAYRQFGQRKPIVVAADGVVVAGNGQLEAARRLGWNLLATVDVEDLTPEQVRAFAVADNRTAELSEWDETMLTEIMKSLVVDAPAIVGYLGWSETELAKLVGPAPEPPVPEPPRQGTPSSKLGEVYALGPHRLLCGDSTEAASYLAVAPEIVDMVWTDPPYGVSVEAASNDRADRLGGTRRPSDANHIENDSLTEDELRVFLAAALGAALSRCRPGACWYVAAPPGPLHQVFGDVLLRLGIWKQSIIWDKGRLVLGRGDYHYEHEPIFYGWAHGVHQRLEDRTQTSVWRIDRPGVSLEHPTMKPIELVARAIRNSSRPGEVVLDPFGGSGTTLIAAAQEGRQARVIELSPIYCDVIRRRWTAWAKANGRDPGPGALE